MRSQRLLVDAQVRCILQPNQARKFMQFRNEDAALTMYFQFGDSPGDINDFFACKPGEVFTYDPTMGLQDIIKGALWMVCPLGSPVIKLIGG